MTCHHRGDKKAAILAAYDPSKTANQIAAELGVKRRTVSTVLYRAKLPMACEKRTLAEYQACAAAGMTRRQCAKALNVSMDAVRSMVHTTAGLAFVAETVCRPQPAMRPVKWKQRQPSKPAAAFSASPEAIRRYLEAK